MGEFAIVMALLFIGSVLLSIRESLSGIAASLKQQNDFRQRMDERECAEYNHWAKSIREDKE